MAVVKMKKVFILTYKDKMDKVTETLQELGIVQITNIFKGEDALSLDTSFISPNNNNDLEATLDENILKLQYLLGFLPVSISEKKSFIEDIVGGKTPIANDLLKKEIDFFDYKSLYDQCKKIESETNELTNEKNNIKKLIELLTPWKELPDVLENIHNTDKTYVVYVHTNLSSYNLLHEALNKDTGEEFVLQKIQETRNEVSCILIYLKQNREITEKILKNCSIIPVVFPLDDLDKKISEILQNSYNKLQEIEIHKQEIENKKQSLSLLRSKIFLLYDHFQTIKNRLSVHNEYGHTEHTITIKGWIKEDNTLLLSERLTSLSDEMLITFQDPQPEKEEVPTALKNHFIIKPFEIVVKLYGLPNYQEKDPTPLIAFFFSIIFAFALSDAVYGLVLAGISYWLCKKYNFDEEEKNIFWLFIWCGLVTAVIGAIMGSWCGDLIDYVPPYLSFIRHTKDAIMLFDPLKDMNTFISISLGIGVVHVFTGLGFKAYQNILKGNIKDAIYDQFSWILLVGSLILLGLSISNIMFSGLSVYFSWSAKIGALMIILFAARDVKNFFGRIGVGVYKLYGASSYISDILSYVRLLALGLATGIIGMVINIMASLTLNIPLGFVLTFLILLGGHIFNLVINLLGAFVHTCRLHYVEFFGKFYDNGGKPFTPFRKEGKYYIIQ